MYGWLIPISAIAGLVLSAASAAVLAQDSTPPPEAAAPLGQEATTAPTSRRVIEEIVVTAQKKVEPIQNVPISITVLPGDFISAAGAEHPQHLVEFTPNVRFEDLDDSLSRQYIRGFGTPFSGTPLEASVGFAIDELPLGNSTFISDPLFDIERVEVLRGPQGILFGKNTTAGLFNITTRKPTDEFTGDLLTRIGGLGERRIEGAIGGPVGNVGKIAQFRLAVIELQREGDVKNTKLNLDLPGTEQRGGRFELGLRPLNNVDILLSGERTTTDTKAPTLGSFQADHMDVASVKFLRNYDPKFEANPFDHQNSQDFATPVHRTSDREQGRFHYGAGALGPVKNAEFTAVLGHAGFFTPITLDADLTPADILVATLSLGWDQRSAESRFSGFLPGPLNFGEVEFLAGFLYFESSWRSSFPLQAGGNLGDYLASEPAIESQAKRPSPGGGGLEDLRAAALALGINPASSADAALKGDGFRGALKQDVRSEAPFFRLAWHLTDHWTASFGGRLTFEAKDGVYAFRCLPPGVLCKAFSAQDFDETVKKRETDFSPHFTIQYQPFDNLTLFATRAAGFKSGGFNEIAVSPDNFQVDKESAVSWEVGAKGTLLDGALSYGGTLFNMNVDNLQLQTSMGVVTVTRNAASARARGFELDFHWFTPWEPLSLRGAGSITDGIFLHFPNATAPQSSASTSQDLSGKRLPFISKRQLSVTPELRFPLSSQRLPLLGEVLPSALVLTTAADLFYRSDMFLDIDDDPLKRQGGYPKLDARIGISTADGAASLSAVVDNVTNVHAKTFSNNNLLFPGAFVTAQEFQRNFYFQFRYQW